MENQEAYESSLEAIERKYTVKVPIPTDLDLSISPAMSVSPPIFHVNEDLTFKAKLHLNRLLPLHPNGTVSFSENHIPICENVVLNQSSFVATCQFQPEKPGIHVVKAEYSEKENLYNNNTSYLIYGVKRYNSSISLDVRNRLKEYVSHNEVVLTALVKGEKTSDTHLPLVGTLKFYINGFAIENCKKVPVQNATCNYKIDDTDAILNMSVEYSGDQYFHPSSAKITLPYKDKFNIQLMSSENIDTPVLTEAILDKSQQATLSYDQKVSDSGATLKFRIIGLNGVSDIEELNKTLDLKIQSVSPTKYEMLEAKNTRIQETELKDIKCTLTSPTDGALIGTCKGFRPIVNNFDLHIALVYKETEKKVIKKILANQLIHFSVQNNNIKSIEISEKSTPTAGCGLNGTTRQRMFDCAMKVSNFGRRVNINILSAVNYNLGDFSEIYWFLVSCPAGVNITAEQCAWLSPIIHSWNIALSSGEFDSNGVPMKNYENSRFLWSGTSYSNGKRKDYDFFSANGKKDNLSEYTQYPYINQNTMPKQKGKARLDKNDVCYIGEDPILFGQNDPYEWQMPSYPMMLTLTGAPYCARNGRGYDQNWEAFCNAGNAGEGFNALHSVFGFSDQYWSSSLDTNYKIAWIFNGAGGRSGKGSGGGLADIDALYTKNAVRCVTTKW